MGTCRRRRRSLTGAVGLTRCTGECVSSSGRGGWLAGGRRGRGTPDTGRWTLDAGRWMLDAGHGALECAAHGEQGARCCVGRCASRVRVGHSVDR